MPHDLSRSSGSSASSSALSYSLGAPESETASSSNHHPNTHHHHHHHKTSKNIDPIDMIDDDEDELTSDDESKYQKKIKRNIDPLMTGQQKKYSIVHPDMIFYCFEILGNHLFNGRHHSHTSASGSRLAMVPRIPTNVPSDPYPLFVTWLIGKEKKLRGCIGTFSPMNLAEGSWISFVFSNIYLR